jgi:lactate permease
MLISTGHPKFESVVVLLIFNTFATVWEAVGTPIWFGFSGLATETELAEVSYKAGISLAIGACILIPLCLTFLMPFALVKKNIIFIYLSLLVCIGPSVGITFVSYEFPALIGGLVGCGFTALLIKFKVGLSPLDPSDQPDRDPNDIGTVSVRSVVADYCAQVEHGNRSSNDDDKNTTDSKRAEAPIRTSEPSVIS